MDLPVLSPILLAGRIGRPRVGTTAAIHAIATAAAVAATINPAATITAYNDL